MSIDFTHSTLPCFLDFEASSLTRGSYPVQVAWSDGAGRLECWLIRPAPEWNDWCDQAEEMHGISRDMIEEVGCDITWLCRRMNRALAGKVVFTDGVHLDRFWLQRLFVAGSFMPRFRLGDVFKLLEPRLPAPEYRAPDLLQCLMTQARRDTPGFAHQADSDVRYLLNLWRRVRNHHPAVSCPNPGRRVLPAVATEGFSTHQQTVSSSLAGEPR
ncbi:hypothetical protein [Ectothiorhodospira variabilis]|uniref:hypothetical protein n=1 Tax=Ectothiorhodospira variabilis TaxID=505694 RepID=UPI001EFC22FB|nr:hypothetical protein [Ectothiorhodospira variabilis]MCG5493101.1 hypothetical protein [Ectothiorhodospira variabilis]MCG5502430.1 hypothetical protein [Ectothiorhodospira variabilis]MCG5505804.1 hypothetical protein [Ectothiorhodospira variabilis]